MSVGGGSSFATINSGLLTACFESGDIHNFREFCLVIIFLLPDMKESVGIKA